MSTRPQRDGEDLPDLLAGVRVAVEVLPLLRGEAVKRTGFLKRAVPRRDPTPPEWRSYHGRCPLCLTSDVIVDRHHAIDKQQLRKRGLDVWDLRLQIDAGRPCCHGPHTSRVRTIPREFVPYQAEEFAAEHGLTWWLDKVYGTRTDEGR
jgi:hypothetical protein